MPPFNRFRHLLPTDFVYDVFVVFSVADIVEAELNTVSRLVYRIIAEKHLAFRVLWAKPPRTVSRIKMNINSANPKHMVRNPKGSVVPSIAPDKNDILGVENVDLVVVFKNDESPEQNRPRLEVRISFRFQCWK
jgi:hypothetical protein